MAIQITIDTSPFTFFLAPEWIVGNVTLQAGGSADIGKTLPAGTPLGGTFAVKTGTLPTGVTLSPTGIFTAAPGSAAANVAGLVLTYTYSA